MSIFTILWIIPVLTAGLQATPMPNPGSSFSNSPSKITVSHVEFLGDVHSATTSVVRDLGFQGHLGPYVLLTYGDTLWTLPEDPNDSSVFRGMSSDSMALATHNPLVVIDPVIESNGYPPQFCPIKASYGEEAATCALGVTNVIETFAGQGILYFLLNHRPGGINNLRGAGVATVTLSNTYPPVPSVTRLDRTWWDGDTEPWYGDVCALRAGDYIYAYGHAKDNPYVYLTRAKWWEATQLETYEYWNGEGWQCDRLYTATLGEKESLFWQIHQGQIFWSPLFNCYMFVYCGKPVMNLRANPGFSAPSSPLYIQLTSYLSSEIFS
jgi:hypothetical protein